MNSACEHPKECLAQQAYYYFYVGLVLGLLMIVLTALAHDLAPVVSMKRLGEDKVQKIHAGALPKSLNRETLVLLDFNFAHSGAESGTESLAGAIRTLTQHQPRAIIVDQVISDLVDGKAAETFVGAVRAAAEAKVDVVLVPSIPPRADKKLEIVASPIDVFRKAPHSHVIIASPLFHPDADGVIRSFRVSDCFVLDGASVPLPTFSGRLGKHGQTGCDRDTKQLPIHYIVGKHDIDKSPALVYIQVDQKDSQSNIHDRVRDKVVLIGETVPTDWGDIHPTPLGEMPGALIHANILLSPQEHERACEFFLFVLGLLTYLALGAFAIWLWLRWYERVQPEGGKALRRPRWWGVVALILLLTAASLSPIIMPLVAGHPEASESISLSMELVGVLVASAVFAGQDFAVSKLYEFKNRCADCISHFPKPQTSFVGLMSFLLVKLPQWLFLRGLLVLAKVPKSIVWLVSFIMAAVFVIIITALLWLVGGAWLLSVGLRVGSLMPVIAASAEALIKAGKHVTGPIHMGLKWLNLKTACLIISALLACGGSTHAQPPPGAAPTSERPDLFQRSWSAFAELVIGSPEARSVRIGAGIRRRGDGSIALQWLPTIPVDGAMLPRGVSDLTLVWTGGTPPFLVSLQSASGNPLGTIRTGSRLVRMPGFTMPSETVFVEISDAQNPPITAIVRPASTATPAPIPATQSGDSPIRAVLELLVSHGPIWRLEALRQLSSLADRDPEATRALELIKHAADTPP